jgi:serine phosphatase RsbU (regulator of sigma subunit)
MATNTQDIGKYQIYLEKLDDLFEKELVEELRTFPIVEFKGGVTLGKASDNLQFIPLVIKGSMRTVRYDMFGKEVPIYNIGEMESCIISITSVYCPGIENGDAISNEYVVIIMVPKTVIPVWMKKYKTWLNFTFKLNEKRMNELVLKNKQVSEKSKEISDSITYAQRIQEAVLPSMETISSLLPNNFILFKPRDIVSGDYYWITQVQNKTVVIVADCTGHGVPGAFMSMLGISLLNKLFVDKEELSAARVLNILREDVKKSLRQDKNAVKYDKKGNSSQAVKDGMDMAIMIFDFKNKAMQFAGAYNPFYLVRNKELFQFKGDRMPVGVHVEEKASFTNHEIDIEKNDIIYAFSDGYVDQIDATGSKKFLTKNFKNLLLEINNLSMDDQKEVLNTKIEEWKGDHDQIDDILVMGIKI